MRFIVLGVLAGLVLFACNMDRRRREEYVTAHPWGEHGATNDDILQGRVSLGMSQEEVVASWGRPLKRRSFATSETWSYPGGTKLYFENGILDRFSSPRHKRREPHDRQDR